MVGHFWMHLMHSGGKVVFSSMTIICTSAV
jgi:hypothetical protein